MEKEIIEKQVTELLNQYGYSMETDTYVDIIDFTKKLGFVVGTADLKSSEDGFIIIQPSKESSLSSRHDRIIGVNSNLSLDAKRFVIAHEFAHSVLHYQQGVAYLHRENKKGKDEKENDADYFAAALLMPRETFKKKYDELTESGLNENAVCIQLSSTFGVPLESASRRISEVNSNEQQA